MRALQILWYCLWRPVVWMGVAARVRRKLSRMIRRGAARQRADRLAEERAAANMWCSERAVNFSAVTELLPFPFTPENLRKRFANEVDAANHRAATCPVEYGGAGHVDLLYSLARAIHARRIVETGVAYGWSSLALLLAIKDGGDESSLWSVDLPYFREWDMDWGGAAVPLELRARWHMVRAADRQGLPIALRRSRPVDFAHYDSDKSASGRSFGYRIMWEALREGGVLVSDDVGDNLAFKSFADGVGRTPIVVRDDRKYQGVLIK